MGTPEERVVLGKVTRRLIPFLFVLYIFNYLDRTNLGIAALTMKADLRLSDTAYGAGAGMFFFGYFFFEVPSNLILERVGARIWIARIMLTWGVISSATMFIRGPGSFYAMRFLLGVAEAGFFPGMILYLSYWYPAAQRAKAVSRFMTAIPLAGVLGGVLGGQLLALNGAMGLKGWQWIFLVEGLPSVLLGLATVIYLTDRPEKAEWLQPEEREWLVERLRRDREHRDQHYTFTLGQAFAQPRLLMLCAVYFAINICGYGLTFWMPLVLQSRSHWTDSHISHLTAIPSLVAAIAMVIVGTHSDHHGERRWHIALALWTGAVGLVAGALVRSPVLTLVAFALTSIGGSCALGPFWAQATSVMSSMAAAGGIAFVNSVGNLGGFAGPAVMGYLKQKTSGFTPGLSVLAGGLLLGGLLILLVRDTLAAPAKAWPADRGEVDGAAAEGGRR